MKAIRLFNYILAALFLANAYTTFNSARFVHTTFGSSFTKDEFINDIPIGSTTESVYTLYTASGLSVVFSLVCLINTRIASPKLSILRESEKVSFPAGIPEKWFIESSPSNDLMSVGLNDHIITFPKSMVLVLNTLDFKSMAEEVHAGPHLTARQHKAVEMGQVVYLGESPLPSNGSPARFYAFKCRFHGIVENYNQGYAEFNDGLHTVRLPNGVLSTVRCPFCQDAFLEARSK